MVYGCCINVLPLVVCITRTVYASKIRLDAKVWKRKANILMHFYIACILNSEGLYIAIVIGNFNMRIWIRVKFSDFGVLSIITELIFSKLQCVNDAIAGWPYSKASNIAECKLLSLVKHGVVNHKASHNSLIKERNMLTHIFKHWSRVACLYCNNSCVVWNRAVKTMHWRTVNLHVIIVVIAQVPIVSIDYILVPISCVCI